MRLIDADNLVSICEIMADKTDSPQIWEQLISMVESVPTIEAEPVKYGRWQDDNRRPKSSRFVCSVCGEVAYYPQNHRRYKPRACGYLYCPNCGARVEDEE